MNILELDSYNLADAVKFNTELNPRIWQGQKMRPKVREKLLQIAADFKQSLGLSDLEVKDITVSGSNAGYTYTPNSDIDLHLVVDIPQADSSDVYRELFDAKKFQYNETHNITIGGYDVELYVENANQPPISQGMYSVVKDDWINIPLKKRSTVNDNAVKSKYDVIKHRIESAIASGSAKRLNNTANKIKKMRQAGLDKHGELGPENLAYKMLRTQGVISKLYTARTAARDKQLSLKEQPKTPAVKYGFRTEDVTMTPDGVSPSTKMFLEGDSDTTDIVHEFIAAASEELGITNMPEIQLHTDPTWSEREHSFGRYTPESHTLEVNLANRHIMDILRTTAHELVHCRQNQDQTLPDEAGETGSKWENQAHAVAGVLMRNFAASHPDMFGSTQVAEASGYIPTKKQKNDPRFSMALTVDIHPGQTGKEANKMSLQTDSQGKPALLMKTANLQESLAAEFALFEASKGKEEPWDRDGYEPPGPEFPPQMPAGTTKIDVEDLTDWYRLGMDISDMDDAEPEDYNQGPPQTVITFASDDLEQQYLKQFKRLGLKTHDMDPDVEGGEDTTGKHLHKELAEEFKLLEEEFLGEIKMTGKNLSQLAKNIKDVKVGLEFEMIVPNVSSDDDDDDEQEPDYDQDERVRDIDDAINFFDDGDYNYGSIIRRTREEMESSYYEWVQEQIDSDWYGDNGREYFEEYLNREDPFDAEEAEEEARNELQTQYGDELDVEEFEKMLFALVDEKRQSYVVDQWEEQGRNFDHAQEEFADEQRENYSEQDWLESQGIRYASDVQNEYTDLQWPYWTSTSNSDPETDIQNVALDFMNAMGMDSVAISDSYHGTYKKWVGDGWVLIGREKPDDCFTIEPDGSLDGDNSSDAGLEFVSPPIPLEDIGTVMSKVQNWAGNYGAYTGLNNKTSMHTNISVPGYDLDKLDYVKAALLLGDEHVLRQFERFGNTYAKPAIEKVRQLVKQKPDQAKELLDKMKSQLNAEASKLIHSGTTDKFTSINTKNNRIEYRSPGGDYLSDIADNPKKLIDTINRMVVTMDAAMDPEKYKQEYQKKLYKLLTGQESGREGATGKKKEIKADDKDLLNIFSRYAAGELPKQALKSFVRQAQLQRKITKGDTGGEKYWWNVGRPGYGARAEVVASSKNEAIAKGKQEYPDWANAQDMTATPLRPYIEPTYNEPTGDAELDSIQRELGLQAEPEQGNWGIWINANERFANQPGSYSRNETPPLMRFPSRAAAEQWIEQQRASRPNMRTDIEVREIEPTAPIPGSTLDLQRQRAAQQGVDTSVDYEIYNRQTGEVVDTAQLRNDEEAMIRLDDYRRMGPHSLTSQQAEQIYGIRRGPGVTNTQTDTNSLRPTGPGPWEVANRSNNQVYFNPPSTYRRNAESEARTWLAHNGHNEADFEVRTREGVSSADAAQGGIVDVASEQPATAPQTLTRPGQGQQVFTGEWKVIVDGEEVYRFSGIGNNQGDANRVGRDWVLQQVRQGTLTPADGADVEVLPVMSEA